MKPSIYDVPCPRCGAEIVDTARMMDDSAAPSHCSAGHEFTRQEAFAKFERKQQLANFYNQLRADLGQLPTKEPFVLKAAQRLKANLQDRIEDIRNKFAIDGYCIQHSNQSITFQFYVHPAPSYIKALDKTYGPHKEGHTNTETIYRWILPGGDIGLNYYLPKDTDKGARIQLYNRSEAHAFVATASVQLEAYDNTWIHKYNQHREAHPKYKGEQKPSQLTDEKVFNLDPSAMSHRLKEVYKEDYGDAARSISLFKNRMGKNLMSPDKNRLDKAKDELKKIYHKEDDNGNENQSGPKAKGPKPSNPHESTNGPGSRSGRTGRTVGTDPVGSRPSGKVIR